MDELEKEIAIFEKEKLANAHNTETIKQKFILEIKSGLGEEIKKNPNKPIILHKSKFKRFTEFCKNLIKKI